MTTTDISTILDRLSDPDHTLHRPALDMLTSDLRTKAPHKIAYLDSHVADLETRLDNLDDDDRRLLCDLLSVLLVFKDPLKSVDYRTKGTVTALGDFGHNYVKKLCWSIVDTKCGDWRLISECVAFLFEHNLECDAIDFIDEIDCISDCISIDCGSSRLDCGRLELSRLDNLINSTNNNSSNNLTLLNKIVEYTDDHNYNRIKLYLQGMSHYKKIYKKILTEIHLKQKNYCAAFVSILNSDEISDKVSVLNNLVSFIVSSEKNNINNNSNNINNTNINNTNSNNLNNINTNPNQNININIKYKNTLTQLYLMAARLNLPLTPHSDLHKKIIDNHHVSPLFRSLVADLQIEKPREIADFLRGGSTLRFGREISVRIISPFCLANCFVHCGFGRDTIFCPGPADPRIEVDLGPLDTLNEQITVFASIGVINVFDHSCLGADSGDNPYRRAGALLGLAIASSKSRSEDDTATQLLIENYFKNDCVYLKASSLISLLFLYCRTNSSFILDCIFSDDMSSSSSCRDSSGSSGKSSGRDSKSSGSCVDNSSRDNSSRDSSNDKSISSNDKSINDGSRDINDDIDNEITHDITDLNTNLNANLTNQTNQSNNDEILPHFKSLLIGSVYAGSGDPGVADKIMESLQTESAFDIFSILGLSYLFFKNKNQLKKYEDKLKSNERLFRHVSVMVRAFANCGSGDTELINEIFSEVFEDNLDFFGDNNNNCNSGCDKGVDKNNSCGDKNKIYDSGDKDVDIDNNTTNNITNNTNTNQTSNQTTTSNTNKLQSLSLIALAVIAMGDDLCERCALRILTSATVIDNPALKCVVPLCIALLSPSNPSVELIDTISKFSNCSDHKVVINAFVALGVLGAGTNNAQISAILESMLPRYADYSRIDQAIRVAQGLLFMGKGTVTLSPFFFNREFLDVRRLIGLLTPIAALIDPETSPQIAKFCFVNFLFIQACSLKYVTTVDADLRPVDTVLSIGRPINVVGVVGRPRRITGVQTHGSPVVRQEWEVVEIGDEEIEYVEDVVVVS